MRRVRAEAQEQLAIETSQMDDHIGPLSRQLKVAEDMLHVLDYAGASSTLVSTVASLGAIIDEAT